VADPRPSARVKRRVVDPPEDLEPSRCSIGAPRHAAAGFRRHVEEALPSAASRRDSRGGLEFLSAPEGSEVAAASEVPAAEAASEVPAAEVPEVAATDRVLDSPVGGIGITETAEGTAEHRANE
jgi:hypothetical protein